MCATFSIKNKKNKVSIFYTLLSRGQFIYFYSTFLGAVHSYLSFYI